MATTTSTAEQLAQLLEAEHTQIEQLIEAVMSSDGEAKAVAFGQVRRYLAVHEAAEEAHLHSLTAPPGAHDRLAEEEAAADAITKLEQMDPGSGDFDEAFAALAKDVKSHAKAEEHEELPTLTKDTTPEDLGEAYVALQLVPELVDQQGGPIPDGTFKQMHEAAAAEMSKLTSQRSD